MTNECGSVQLRNSRELSEVKIIESIIGLLYKLSGWIFIICDILIKTNCSWHISSWTYIQCKHFTRKSRLWKDSICLVLKIIHYLEVAVPLLYFKFKQTRIRQCETLGPPSAGNLWELQWWLSARVSRELLLLLGLPTRGAWRRGGCSMDLYVPRCLQEGTEPHVSPHSAAT